MVGTRRVIWVVAVFGIGVVGATSAAHAQDAPLDVIWPRDSGVYVLEMHPRVLRSGADTGAHLIVAGGRAAAVRRRALWSPEPLKRRRLDARTERLTYPPYPSGGINGGHVALVRASGPDRLDVVSVHGREHVDVANAMLDSLRP